MPLGLGMGCAAWSAETLSAQIDCHDERAWDAEARWLPGAGAHRMVYGLLSSPHETPAVACALLVLFGQKEPGVSGSRR
jgi:hypothetical protein